MDCSPPGCTVLGILQPRNLECVAIPFSRRSSWPRDPMHISLSFLHWQATSLQLVPPGKPSNGPWLRNKFISKTKERQWNKTWDRDWNMCMCWISDFMEATQGQTEISLPWSWRALSHSIMSWTVSPQNTDTETLTWLYLETGPLKRWLVKMWPFQWALTRSECYPYMKRMLNTLIPQVCTHRGQPAWGHSKKVAMGKTRRKASGETKPAYTLILDFQPPKLWNNKCLLFKTPCLLVLYLCVIEAQADSYISQEALQKDQGKHRLEMRRLKAHVGLCHCRLHSLKNQSLWASLSSHAKMWALIGMDMDSEVPSTPHFIFCTYCLKFLLNLLPYCFCFTFWIFSQEAHGILMPHVCA